MTDRTDGLRLHRRCLVLLLVAGTTACERAAPSLVAPDKELNVVLHSSATDAPRITAPTGAFKANRGTLPEAQGWIYSGDNGNPSPTITGGALFQNSTAGVQYWETFQPVISFTSGYAFEARLKVISSNYNPGSGPSDTGTREGYYFTVTDSTSSYTIGIADGGVNINSICTPNQPLTPYSLADGAFHELRFRVVGRLATLSIDGVVLASNVPPDPFSRCFALPGVIRFGALAGISRSVTELKDVVYRVW